MNEEQEKELASEIMHSEPLDCSINFYNKVIIEPNGDIKHNGKVVTSDKEIYTALMEIVTLGYANCPNVSKLLEEEREKAREEERNEIIKFCEEHRTVRKVNGVRYINIEQLKAKYIKVVE